MFTSRSEMTGENLIWSYSPQGRICGSDRCSVSFSIFGHDVSARDFRDHLQTAAGEIKTLLSDGDSRN